MLRARTLGSLLATRVAPMAILKANAMFFPYHRLLGASIWGMVYTATWDFAFVFLGRSAEPLGIPTACSAINAVLLTYSSRHAMQFGWSGAPFHLQWRVVFIQRGLLDLLLRIPLYGRWALIFAMQETYSCIHFTWSRPLSPTVTWTSLRPWFLGSFPGYLYFSRLSRGLLPWWGPLHL